MNSALSNKFLNTHPRIEWLLMKLSLASVWLYIVCYIFIDGSHLPYPVGICSLVDCSFLISEHTAQYFYQVALVLALLYMLDVWMKGTTFLMFVLSCLLFTLEESNGVLNRSALYTMLFFAQWLAYLKGGPDLRKNRIQFSVQIIAAGYFLAATSKLIAAGPGWVTDAPLASIQIFRSYAYSYFNNGDVTILNDGLKKANFVLQNKPFVILLFGISLLLELTAWVALINKRNAFIYGCLLFAMHMGIYYFMDILIVAIFYPMLIIMINPLYLGYFMLKEAVLWLKARLEYYGYVVEF